MKKRLFLITVLLMAVPMAQVSFSSNNQPSIQVVGLEAGAPPFAVGADPIDRVSHEQDSVEQLAIGEGSWEKNSDSLPRPDKCLEPAKGTLNFDLAVFYVVPAGISYDVAVHRRLIEATVKIQEWYRCATGGLTWTFAYPETVQVYYGLQTREYYRNNGDWWGSLPGEMSAHGKPIWTSGTVTAIWAQGAGWWAGAAQWCDGNCGLALLGVEAFPEFNNPLYSGGNCPGGTGGAAWPCTPDGAYAHELGHTIGLPHPADISETAAVAFHSIMQTHWNFPSYAPPDESPWGLLTREISLIQSNPFMKALPSLQVTYSDCDIVNLPLVGAAPVSSFRYQGAGNLAVKFTSTSQGASRSWWAFGDGSDSHSSNPTHTFPSNSDYLVRLRVMNSDGMGDVSERLISVGSIPVCGDADRSEQVDLSDAVFLVNYVFSGAPAPDPLESADVDCSNQVDLTDVIYLIAYIFNGGSAPCAACK